MSTSSLQFETPQNAPLKFKFYATQSYSEDSSLSAKLTALLNHHMSGYQDLTCLDAQLEKCLAVYQKFSHKKHFIHVGMGGSVLGAEVLIQALANNNSKVIFLNNLDADDIFDKLSTIDLTQSLIYLVSKSGSTLETHLMMQLLLNQLKLIPELKNKSDEELLRTFFVFATDPQVGKMRELATLQQITCLEIPPNLGGRFCAFSAVTFLPALFAQINLDQFCQGAKAIKNFFLNPSQSDSMMRLANLLVQESQKNKSQTVLMPYSSKLKSFTHWFAQLWGESLGKKNSLGINLGLTPIVAHGPADQHSLLQLFMEGPNDKTYFFIKILNTHHNYTSFKDELAKKNLTQIVHAQLEGTMSALQQNAATMTLIEIDELNAYSLGMLMYFFEHLTVVTGAALSIDPFNQPGVELGKNLTWSILRDGKSPLLNKK